jgi:hypothetical protein
MDLDENGSTVHAVHGGRWDACEHVQGSSPRVSASADEQLVEEGRTELTPATRGAVFTVTQGCVAPVAEIPGDRSFANWKPQLVAGVEDGDQVGQSPTKQDYRIDAGQKARSSTSTTISPSTPR